MSVDGHDKLCGFQKSMFPLCVYGGQDAFSGKICFLRVWTSNNNPSVIGRHYFQHVIESKGKRLLRCCKLLQLDNSYHILYMHLLIIIVIPHTLRMDRGTETDLMSSIHCHLHQRCGTYENLDVIIENCIKYGPSTANKIERWWRELHHRMETYFKDQLKYLVESGHYDQTSHLDR